MSKSVEEAIAELNEWEKQKKRLDDARDAKMWGGNTSATFVRAVSTQCKMKTFVEKFSSTIEAYINELKSNSSNANNGYERSEDLWSEWEAVQVNTSITSPDHYQSVQDMLAQGYDKNSIYYSEDHCRMLKLAKEELESIYTQYAVARSA